MKSVIIIIDTVKIFGLKMIFPQNGWKVESGKCLDLGLVAIVRPSSITTEGLSPAHVCNPPGTDCHHHNVSLPQLVVTFFLLTQARPQTTALLQSQ